MSPSLSSDEDVDDIHTHTLNVESENSGSKLAYHPYSLMVLLVWTAFIAVLIVLLEPSAAVATTSIYHPWYYDPGVSTVFAQAHVAVTAIYLGRLSMSALYTPGYSPASWAELFWQADRNWQSPVGILFMMYIQEN
jgi:hypothetical protein